MAAKKDGKETKPAVTKTAEKPESKPEGKEGTGRSVMAFGEQGGVAVRNMDDAYRFASAVAQANCLPKGVSQAQAFIAVCMGAELGLTPMSSITDIAVINGRPSLWGDALKGLVLSSHLCQQYKTEKLGTGQRFADDYGWRVTTVRKGAAEPMATEFTVADAKQAGLWGKSGPWSQYPDRMLLNRARSFNFRDNFPDVLKGIAIKEEAQDMVEPEYEVIDTDTGEVRDTTKSASMLDEFKKRDAQKEEGPGPDHIDTPPPTPAPPLQSPPKEEGPAPSSSAGAPQEQGSIFGGESTAVEKKKEEWGPYHNKIADALEGQLFTGAELYDAIKEHGYKVDGYEALTADQAAMVYKVLMGKKK